MSDRDLTTAVGRLLTDPVLRREFENSPVEVARKVAIRDVDREAFLSLDPREVQAQAQTLLEKRLHEVARLLPVTFKQLDPRARTYFLDYANSRWPKGHARHLDDAVGFCHYLGEIGVMEVSRSEFNRVKFILERGRFSIHFVKDFPVNDRRRPALQILFRRHRRHMRQGVLFLA